MVPAQTELELRMSSASIIILLFLRGAGWVGCGGYVGGGWVLKLMLMLTQPPTKLELRLGLSLAKTTNIYRKRATTSKMGLKFTKPKAIHIIRFILVMLNNTVHCCQNVETH